MLSSSTRIPVDEETNNYIANVMRIRDGGSVRGFNEEFGEYLFSVSVQQSKRRTSCSLTSVRKIRAVETCKPLPCALFFAPFKKERMKLMLEKATELGVGHLVPVLTQNVSHSLPSDLRSLQKVLVQSAEQSERISIPVLHPAVSLSDVSRWFCGSVESDRQSPCQSMSFLSSSARLLVCRERDASARPVLTILRENNEVWFRSTAEQPSFALLVGPEGGFSASELLQLTTTDGAHTSTGRSAEFVSLGSNVLRAETAAICALSAVSAVANDHS